MALSSKAYADPNTGPAANHVVEKRRYRKRRIGRSRRMIYAAPGYTENADENVSAFTGGRCLVADRRHVSRVSGLRHLQVLIDRSTEEYELRETFGWVFLQDCVAVQTTGSRSSCAAHEIEETDPPNKRLGFTEGAVV